MTRPTPVFPEARQDLYKMNRYSAAAGCAFRDVVDVTSFHVDPESHFGLVMRVKDETFPGPNYPNWTAVGVTWLSGFQFEIKAIARIPAGS